MPPKMTHLDTSEIIKRYYAGASGLQLAREYGVSSTTLYRILQVGGVIIQTYRRPKFVPKRRIPLPETELLALYEQGMSVKALSQRYEVARSVIQRRLNDKGIKGRGHSEAERLKWQHMSPEQRQQQTKAAHQAVLGRRAPTEERRRTALTKQRQGYMTPDERIMQSMLRMRGIETIPQHAIGIYNCDLGAFPVAVEIHGGNWHWHGRHATRLPKRMYEIFHAGWAIIVIHVIQRSRGLCDGAADAVAAFIQEARRNPSLIGQYRVIRGTGEDVTSGSLYANDRPLIPPLT